MTRVVADSNVLVSGLQFGGTPMALLTLAEEGQIDLAISEAILTETLGVLRLKFHNTEEQLAIGKCICARLRVWSCLWKRCTLSPAIPTTIR